MTIIPREKPKRPLSSFNIFFQLERKRLLESLPVSKSVKSRKAHGKISFTDLARMISREWKKVTPERKAQCICLANQDKLRYLKEMDEWRNSLNDQVQEDCSDPDTSVGSQTTPSTSSRHGNVFVHPFTPTMSYFVNASSQATYVGQSFRRGTVDLKRVPTTKELLDQVEMNIFENGRPSMWNPSWDTTASSHSMLTDKDALTRLAHDLGEDCKDMFVATFATPY